MCLDKYKNHKSIGKGQQMLEQKNSNDHVKNILKKKWFAKWCRKKTPNSSD